MNIRNFIIVLLPVLLYACTTLKPAGELTDKELIDKYYKTDLNLYMVKRDASKTKQDKIGHPIESGSSQSGYSSRDAEKIKKIEDKLTVLKQELLKRGYMP
ncbi:MAG: hypothetical protein ACYSTS_09420 [Planctomycetota bacterium]|jgi:hypothetical protein